MADVTGRQFRMVTNMKAAPNSQGTLFQGGYPTRYPRGFTPERRADVMDALDLRLDLHGGNRGVRRAAWSYRKENTQGVETISRSTVPLEHLKGVTTYFDAAGLRDDVGGQYQPRGDGFFSRQPTILVKRGRAATKTTIHEVGHHVSQYVDRNPHAAYETPSQRGTEEAYAENYAETHFRDRRGRPIKDFFTEPYGWSKREADDDSRRKFNAAFDSKRRESPSTRARRAAERAGDEREANPTGVKGQIPLLDKVGPKHAKRWQYKHPDDDLGSG